jgi:hypothetical protein
MAMMADITAPPPPIISRPPSSQPHTTTTTVLPPGPPPDRECPLNQVTSSNAAQYPTSASFYAMTPSGFGGFTSSRACVNQPGYGLNARVSSKCEPGWYNEGDTAGSCKACPAGLTTAGEGAALRSQCGLVAGYGFTAGAIQPCPVGELDKFCAGGKTLRCTAVYDPYHRQWASGPVKWARWVAINGHCHCLRLLLQGMTTRWFLMRVFVCVPVGTFVAVCNELPRNSVSH